MILDNDRELEALERELLIAAAAQWMNLAPGIATAKTAQAVSRRSVMPAGELDRLRGNVGTGEPGRGTGSRRGERWSARRRECAAPSPADGEVRVRNELSELWLWSRTDWFCHSINSFFLWQESQDRFMVKADGWRD